MRRVLVYSRSTLQDIFDISLIQTTSTCKKFETIPVVWKMTCCEKVGAEVCLVKNRELNSCFYIIRHFTCGKTRKGKLCSSDYKCVPYWFYHRMCLDFASIETVSCLKVTTILHVAPCKNFSHLRLLSSSSPSLILRSNSKSTSRNSLVCLPRHGCQINSNYPTINNYTNKWSRIDLHRGVVAEAPPLATCVWLWSMNPSYPAPSTQQYLLTQAPCSPGC